MYALRRALLAMLIFSVVSQSATAAYAQSDQVIAQRILGPQWRQFASRAGLIFAGTVLGEGTEGMTIDRPDRPVSSIAVSFRVDRAIAGVEPGQILTIHEWSGALSRQLPMRTGERFLLFLYAPSRLGLTSPVGGASGQIRLDSTGRTIAGPGLARPISGQSGGPQTDARSPSSSGRASPVQPSVTVDQLVRAIRRAKQWPAKQWRAKEWR